MALDVASYSNQAWNAAADASTAVFSKPSGLDVGDLMIAHLVLLNASNTYTTPDGWTLIGTEVRTSQTYQVMMRKVAGASDVAASTFTFNLSGNSYRGGGLVRVTDYNTATPIDDVGQGGHVDSAVATISTDEVDPTYTGSLFLMFTSNNQGSTVSSWALATGNPSWTEVYDITNAASGGCACAKATRTDITASGNWSFTNDGGSAGTDSSAHLVIIRPKISVTVSPNALTSTGTANAPTVTGGATFLASTIQSTGTVNGPTAGKADWSYAEKPTMSWTQTSK